MSKCVLYTWKYAWKVLVCHKSKSWETTNSPKKVGNEQYNMYWLILSPRKIRDLRYWISNESIYGKECNKRTKVHQRTSLCANPNSAFVDSSSKYIAYKQQNTVAELQHIHSPEGWVIIYGKECNKRTEVHQRTGLCANPHSAFVDSSSKYKKSCQISREFSDLSLHWVSFIPIHSKYYFCLKHR